MFDQDEADLSEGEGSLDRTTQVTGRHCGDGFYDQDEADLSLGLGLELEFESGPSPGLPHGPDQRYAGR